MLLWKVRLKLVVVFKCILGVSWSISLMNIFRQFLTESCPLLWFEFAKFLVSR